VARSAARELGKLRNERAIPPLVALLGNPAVNQAAAEALLGFGSHAVGPLLEVLQMGNGEARRAAAFALGELRDKRAVEPLILVMQTDEVYAVRASAATALGQLKDSRAVWVLVATLRMRDETAPERQAALEQLRQATTLALRRIGDPLLAAKPATATPVEPSAEVEPEESGPTQPPVHPRLVGDAQRLNTDELVEILKELINASEEISWAKLESREALLPAYFITYEQRASTAEAVGKELHRRGGTALMKQILEQQLHGQVAISNWWSGIGGWV